VHLARKHNLLLIEDYDGCLAVQLVPLKTATSLASGILRAKDPELFGRLCANHGPIKP
jgi:hypothetical protein